MTTAPTIPQPPSRTGNPPGETDLHAFKESISGLIGFDLSKYKKPLMERRICALMRKNNCRTLREYSTLLQMDNGLLEEFANGMTVTVTEFFRGTECFREIEEHHVRLLLKKKQTLTVWSAGCANGAEIYSLVMMLDEMGLADRFIFYATDISQKALKQALNGIYSPFEFKSVPEPYRKYFTVSDDGACLLSACIKERVRFKRRDLLDSTDTERFDLILCRNVSQFLTESAVKTLARQLCRSLTANGLLITGELDSGLGSACSTEKLIPEAAFGWRKISQN